MTPEEYLQAKGFKVRVGSEELQTQCPFCGDTNKYGHLYVNRDHGVYMCHRCGASGSFFHLQSELGDKSDVSDYVSTHSIWMDLTALGRTALMEELEAWEYLRSARGLSAATIEKYQLGWVPGNWMDVLLKKWTIQELKVAGLVTDKNYPLFWDRVLIPYFHGNRIVTVRAKQIGGNILQAKDTSIRLFGVDNIKGQTDAYICEGEFDAMFLDQLGFPACAVPGALNFQDHWTHHFDEAKRVVVCLDADDAGRKGAEKIVSMLDQARAIDFPVPLEHKTTDVTEFFLRDLHVKEDFRQLVSTVFPSRLFVFAEMIREMDEMLTLEGIKLKIADLDLAIEPGLLPGQLVTVLAKTGTGKTALLIQLVHNMSSYSTYDKTDRGLDLGVMFISLEQTKAEIAARLLKTGRMFNPWATVEDIGVWHQSLRVNDENRIPPKELGSLVEHYEEQLGIKPRLLFIDYLGYWARSFPGNSRYEQVSEAIMELKALAKELGVAIIVPHQVSRIQKRGEELEMDFARDSGVIEESSDFMFGLYRPSEKRKEEEYDGQDYRVRGDVRLQILKSRHGGVGRQSMLLWAPFSLAFVARGSQYEKRVGEEWLMYDVQASYDQVLESHRGRSLPPYRR